jgi:arylsulfatase A-like enzyme
MSAPRLRQQPRLAQPLARIFVAPLVALCACGDLENGREEPAAEVVSSEAPPSLQRFELAAVGETVGYRSPRTFWSWSADAEDLEGSFRLESGEAHVIHRDGRQLLFLDRSRGKVDLRVPLPLKAEGAWILEVEAQTSGLEIEVWAGVIPWNGKALVLNRDLVQSQEPVVTSFRLGTFDQPTRHLVELRLGIAQGDAPVVLSGLRLRQAPPDFEIGPEAFGGMALVNLGDDALRATALRANEALSTYIDCEDPRTVLRFHYGIPESIDPGTGGRVLRVRAESDATGGELRAEFPLETAPGGGWRQAELPLEELGAGQIYVEFEYQADGPNDLLALGQPRTVVPRTAPRTVVLMTSDTHRADHVGFRNEPEFLRSPAIDRLAERGVAFLDATSSANNTTPSHVSLLTGLSPLGTKLVSNGVRLSDAAPTLTEVFAENGYTTLASVSALPLYHEFTNLGQGFDRFSNPRDQNLRKGSDSLDALLAALDDYPDEPVFAWLHVYDAHAPYTPPEDLERLYYAPGKDPYDPEIEGARPELAPRWNREIADPAYTEALYRSEVSYVDGLVDRLLGVDRVGEGLFALTSDHGEVLSRGSDPEFSHKGVSWNTLSVPLIFAGAAVPAGVQRSEAVRQIDTGRTLLNLAGLEAIAFPGRDLFADPADRPPAAGEAAEKRFAIEANGLGASILEGDHLLRILLRLRKGERASARHRVQLFDRSVDPFGEVDLVQERPELAARLRSELIDWLSGASNQDFSEATGGDQAEVARQLAELGYSSTGAMAAKTWIDPECECEWCRRFD